MNKKLIFITILTLSFHSLAFKKPTLTICTSYLPAKMTSEDGAGLFGNILRESLKEKYQFSFKKFPYNRTLHLLKSNECDILSIASGMESQKEFLTVNSLLNDYFAIYTNTIAGVKSVKSAKSKDNIALVIKNWNTPDQLKRRFKDVIEVRDYQTAVKMLRSSRYHFLIGKELIIDSYIKESINIDIQGIKKEKTSYKSQYDYLLKRGVNSYELKAKIEHYLREFKKSGKYLSTIQKYELPKSILAK